MDSVSEGKIEFGDFLFMLNSIHNRNGTCVTGINEYVQELYSLTDDPYELEELLKYQSSEGEEKFYIATIIEFLKSGYTCNNLLTLARLKDHAGNTMLNHSNGIYDLLDIEITSNEAISLIEGFAKIRDKKGQTVFRIDPTNESLEFTGLEVIINLIKKGIKPEQVEALVEIIDGENNSLFKTPAYIFRFLEHGGTKELAQKLLTIKDHLGTAVLDEFTMGLAVKYKISIDDINHLVSLKDDLEQTVFSNGYDVIEFLQSNKKMPEAKNMVEAKGTEGKTIFRDGRDIIDFMNAKGTINEAEALANIKNNGQKSILDGHEIAFLKKMNVPIDFIKKMALHGLNAHTIVLFYKLGLDEKNLDYQNSGKPKALLLHTTSDDADNISREHLFFENTGMIKDALGEYDVKIRAISTVNEMLAEEFNVDLLWIAGHGSPTTLQLGRDRPKYGVTFGGAGEITTHTDGLKNKLGAIKKHGVVFLDACNCGQGKEGAPNLANYFGDMLPPSTTLYSATEGVNLNHINVRSLVPFNINFNKYGKDATYVIHK